jgi:DNA primase
MPSVDYTELKARVSIAEVLRLCGFIASETAGDQVRGPCPIHGSTSPSSRSFSVNLRKHTYRCFKCGTAGNQLDLWVAISKLPLHAAARDLCERLCIEVPEISRG